MRVIADRVGVSRLFVDETLEDAERPLYFHHRVVPPGSRSHAAHVHDPAAGQVECLFVIEGQAEVQIEDEVFRVAAGEGVAINTLRLHGFRNAGDTPLRYIVMTAPGPPAAPNTRRPNP